MPNIHDSARFTPGPWELQAGRSFKTSSGSFFLAYGNHPKSGRPDFQNFAELDDNALLISAAPEMYEALALAVATIERLDKKGSAVGTLDVLRAALAKADGSAQT